MYMYLQWYSTLLLYIGPTHEGYTMTMLGHLHNVYSMAHTLSIIFNYGGSKLSRCILKLYTVQCGDGT